MLHGAVLFALLAGYPLSRLNGAATSYDIVMVQVFPKQAPAAEPPTEPEQQADTAANANSPPETEPPASTAQVAPETKPAPAPERGPAQMTESAPSTNGTAPVPATERAPPLTQESAPPSAIPAPAASSPPAVELSAPSAAAAPEPKPVSRVRPQVTASALHPVRQAPARSEAARQSAVPPVPAGPSPGEAASASAPNAAGPDPAWLASVSRWLTVHQYYPDIAQRRGEQGTVVVRFEADRSGRVLNASLVHGSGLALLDQAALALLRGASLPPFPSDMASPSETVTVPVRYRLE